MRNKNIRNSNKEETTKVVDKISTINHAGHIIRTVRKIVDRAKLGAVEIGNRPQEKLDTHKCRINCMMDEINRYPWELKHLPEHWNFI